MSHGLELGLLIVFWAACALVVYTYIGYPMLLFLASSAAELRRCWQQLLGKGPRTEGAAVEQPDTLPRVSIVVAAHNEERELPELIACLSQLDYPRARMELIVVSDGSTDGTDAYLNSLQEPWIRVHRQDRQQGKAAALNVGVGLARHPVLLLSDASTRPQPGSLRKLAGHFTDPGVGVVCGGLRFAHNGETQKTEGAYWSFECLLRIMEGRLGATLTASGAFYAVRKACFPSLSTTSWIEDFLVPLHARQAGYRVVYEPEAWAWEFPAPSVGGEFRRRVRLAIGSFRAMGTLLRARVDGATRWALISHKLLRWAVPFLLLAMLAANVALWPLPAYRWLLLAQLAGYGAACAAGSGFKPLRHSRMAQGLYFFFAMNAAFLWGFVLFLRDRGESAWQQVR